ncbi:MAG: LysR family transcriptional regulator [Lachnospiraceae bacterium]|nr:LysR family transcriptional regulator [Lachnospiraceae bacterium]
MELDRIHEFLVINQNQSIKKAAETLSVSYATLLARLNGFEKAYNIKLFERSRAGLTLSEFGRRFLPAAEEFQEIYRHITAYFNTYPSASSEKLMEFRILVQAQNFSKAAKALFVSQSMLSKHLKDLEKQFHCTLLTRSTHGVALTKEGEWLYTALPDLLEICDHLETLLKDNAHGFGGHVRFGCALEFSYANHIQSFMVRFIKRHPEIEFEFEVMPSGTGPNDPGRYDCILTPCAYVPLASGIAMAQINSHSIYALVSKGHPLAKKTTISCEDLRGETILVPFATEAFGPYARNFQVIKKHTGDKALSQPVKNLSSAIFCASVSGGIILVPKYVKHLIPDNLELIQLDHKDLTFDELFYFQPKNTNQAAQLFQKEFLKRYSQRL